MKAQSDRLNDTLSVVILGVTLLITLMFYFRLQPKKEEK